jgi:signal transduction histidine kinase
LNKKHEKLELSREDIKSLNNLESDIITNLAHELRTPLTVALGALELAKGEENPEKRTHLLKMVREELKHHDFIIEDLIDAAKVRGGSKKKFKTSTTNLKAVISLAISELEQMTPSRNVEFNIHVKKNLPRVRGDYLELNRVLRNLLDNAVKFSYEGSKIGVSAVVEDDMVRVCVEDTGIGISKEFHEKIFDRCFQLDASSTRKYAGTGMGLAVVKETIESYGGKISVESVKGKGSKFCFTVPKAAESSFL